MANTISGFAGVSFAVVNLTGTSSASTTADISGNYSFPGLSNGPYTVTPTLSGYTFSPSHLNETISGSDITNASFAATMSIGPAPTLAQTVQDTFIRANENPLNPSNWTVTAGPGGTFTALQIISNACVSTDGTGSAEGAEEWTGTVLPSNMFSAVTVGALGPDNFAELHSAVRQVSNVSGTLTGYDLALLGPLGAAVGNILLFDQVTHNIIGSGSVTISTGDEFILAVVGSTIYASQNGVGIIQVNGNVSTPTGGHPEINCTPDSGAVSSVSITKFRAGSASTSSQVSISGNAGVAKANIAFTGATSGSVVADGNGNYTIPVVNGSYTLTPSLAGFIFTPAKVNETVTGLSIPGVNFTASTPATNGTIFPGQYGGPTLATAFSNPYKLDLLQIVNEGGAVVWNLTATGVANNNPTSPTSEALVARFLGSNFASTFPQTQNLDIFQIYTTGGGIVFHVNYLGMPSTP